MENNKGCDGIVSNKKYVTMLTIATLTTIFFLVMLIAFGMQYIKNKDVTNEMANTLSSCQTEVVRLKSVVAKRPLCNVTKEKLVKTIILLQPKVDPVMAAEISEVVMRECVNKNLDPSLIIGLIKIESNFNPFAESGKGAIGLMQIRYTTWKEEPELLDNGVPAKGALFWIDRNITAGTHILQKYYIESDCDLAKALYRYNTGKRKMPIDYWRSDYVSKVIYNAYLTKAYLSEDNKCSAEIIEEELPPVEEEVIPEEEISIEGETS